MNSKSKTRAYLTPKEAAEFLKVSTETVRQWAKTGLLNAETTLGGHRRFSKEEVSRFAKALQKREKTKTDNLRVLIVDDDQQYVRFVEELVSGFADHIITEKAFDGFEAGHKIDIFRPDIVLLDLVMPSINGIEVCRYLKQNKKTRHIRIIATTGFTSDLNVQNFLNAGAEA
ncbi:MAG: response regulator, partial [Gammaproteobacteria bacterium]